MPKRTSRVLLTGAFGTVGTHTLPYLVEQGHQVTCLDIRTAANERKQRDLAQRYRFAMVWIDLRQPRAVRQVIQQVEPEVIVHLAAMIPPLAYLDPQMAYEVNVGGTRHVIEAAQCLSPAPGFIYTSSYSIHGPRNPYKKLPLLTASTPPDPGDNYAQHKVAGEQMVQASGLPWTILRFCGVMPLALDRKAMSELLRFLFMLPVARRQHGIDCRDVGLAVANAASANAAQETLVVGGGEDWRVIAGQFMGSLFDALGPGRLPDAAFRLPDPDVDGSWYYEDWADTSKSQDLLDYQNHSLTEFLEDARRQAGALSALARPLAPLIRHFLVRQSPYHDRGDHTDSRSHWEHVCEVYGLDARWLDAGKAIHNA